MLYMVALTQNDRLAERGGRVNGIALLLGENTRAEGI